LLNENELAPDFAPDADFKITLSKSSRLGPWIITVKINVYQILAKETAKELGYRRDQGEIGKG
jgi:hypothetical protein